MEAYSSARIAAPTKKLIVVAIASLNTVSGTWLPGGWRGPSPVPFLGVRANPSLRPARPRSTARVAGAVSPTPVASVTATEGSRRRHGRFRLRPAAA